MKIVEKLLKNKMKYGIILICVYALLRNSIVHRIIREMVKEERNTMITAIYDCRSKQEYIYRTNKIREIAGASKLLADVFRVQADEFACSNGLRALVPVDLCK